MKRQDKKWEDDGRTIVSMDVPGMPPRFLSKRQKPDGVQARIPVPVMDKSQTRQFIFSAIGAGLLVSFVFIAGMVLFVLFALNVWLK